MIWAKPGAFNLKATALCAGSFLVSPYALFYDLSILSIAVAFFVKEGLSGGFLPGERTAILICWVCLLFFTWRSGPVIGAVLLFLSGSARSYERNLQPREVSGIDSSQSGQRGSKSANGPASI